MRKAFFVFSSFLLFSTSFSLTPFEMGSCEYTYNMSGGFVMDKVTSFNITIYSLPDNCDPGFFVNESGENNHITISEQNPHSPYIWSFECNVSVERQIVNLQKMDPFPTSYDSPYLGYAYSSDFSPELFDQASSIVEGSATVVEAGMRIAKWVHENLEYDRNYDQFYEDERGKASQVFETRRGVCDEFTTLFVSMARSIGIPARYVSGIAYSDIYNGYGMHAWAEFFAGQWIPVDLTFGEFGIIDASHIALSRSFDGNFTPISMSWAGYSGNSFEAFNTFPNKDNKVMGPTQFSIFLEPDCNKEQKIFAMNATIDRQVISDNDYALVTVGFENPYEYYVVLPIRFMRIDSLELVYGSYEDYVVLSPSGKTTKKYLIHVKDLDDSYKYSMPLLLLPDFSEAWNKTITINPKIQAKTLSYYMPNISQGTEIAPGIEISNLTFYPNPSYDNKTFLLFTSKNTGNKIINLSLDLNYGNYKQTFYLGKLLINQEKNHNLTVPLVETGEFDSNLRFYSENISLVRKSLLIRAPNPNLSLLYEGNTTFFDENIEFNITKQKCYSGNIYIMTNVAGIMYDQARNEFNPPPDIFFPGQNEMNISLLCIDQYGKSFFNSTTQEITISVSGFDYIVWLFKSVFRRIMNFFEPKLL